MKWYGRADLNFVESYSLNGWIVLRMVARSSDENAVFMACAEETWAMRNA
jgi:hypothetical protein